LRGTNRPGKQGDQKRWISRGLSADILTPGLLKPASQEKQSTATGRGKAGAHVSREAPTGSGLFTE